MEDKAKKTPSKMTVHHVLAHSYSVYLFSIFIAIILDSFLPLRIIPANLTAPIGLILLAAAPLLILWAQRTSGSLKNIKGKLTSEHFKRGPYRITRGPTHLGLGLLIIGLGFLTNSIFVIVGGILAYFISKNLFLKEQEKMLAENYGEEYLKYQEEVDPWF